VRPGGYGKKAESEILFPRISCKTERGSVPTRETAIFNWIEVTRQRPAQ